MELVFDKATTKIVLIEDDEGNTIWQRKDNEGGDE